MPYLQRPDADLYYEDTGHKEQPALLLTHGYAASADMWRPQVAALQDRVRVLTWDMRGHARTDCDSKEPARFTQDLSLDDMAALLDHLGVDKAVVGGQSLGGYLSLAFQKQHPERVLALSLLSTGPGFRNDHARDQWNAFAHRQADKYQARGLAALSTDSPEIPQELHRSAAGLAQAARGILTQTDGAVMAHLPHISVPTLIVVGDADPAYTGSGAYMARKIAGAEHHVLVGAGHAPNLEQPDAYNALLLAFLRDTGLLSAT